MVRSHVPICPVLGDSSGIYSIHLKAGGKIKFAADQAGGAYTVMQTEVTEMDRKRRTVTIRHGPLQGMNVPGMTGSYLVKDRGPM
jgi:Cu/Ag efflux protein CusF